MPEQNRADVGIWRVEGSSPQRYLPASLEYEKHLEDWIEQDISLISADIQIVGRQIRLDTGILDILGLDNFGRWTVIELKRQGVRRDTVAQAMDYAGCLADMSPIALKALAEKCLEKRGIRLKAFLKGLVLDETIFQQPEILIYVVGTSRDINLGRMLKHTTFQNHPIHIVTFDVYKNSDGEHVLLRQLSETDLISPAKTESTLPSKASSVKPATDRDARLERLMKISTENGVGDAFRKVYEVTTNFGLFPKLYKWSIMYSPPQNKNRVLMCAWVNAKQGLFDIYINPNAFAEFYPISVRRVQQLVKLRSRDLLNVQQSEEFIADLQKLFNEITATP